MCNNHSFYGVILECQYTKYSTTGGTPPTFFFNPYFLNAQIHYLFDCLHPVSSLSYNYKPVLSLHRIREQIPLSVLKQSTFRECIFKIKYNVFKYDIRFHSLSHPITSGAIAQLVLDSTSFKQNKITASEAINIFPGFYNVLCGYMQDGLRTETRSFASQWGMHRPGMFSLLYYTAANQGRSRFQLNSLESQNLFLERLF